MEEAGSYRGRMSTSPGPSRAAHMESSVAAAARSVGLDGSETAALERIHSIAMAPRTAALDDDHHPAYLHPGRTAIVLLKDVGRVDPVVLALSMLHESVDFGLSVEREAVASALGEGALGALAALPVPGDERLVERLVSLGPGSSLAVLAERLDHLRHLHLREDLIDSWASTYAEVLEAWLPFANRIHPKLAGRFAHWARLFVKRI